MSYRVRLESAADKAREAAAMEWAEGTMDVEGIESERDLREI
jgi:hypothetical protein